jgi:hypothetical protein
MSATDIKRGVEDTAALLVEHPDFDDETLVRTLESRGVEGVLCERLVTFVPLAFGRVSLQADPPRFSDEYLVPAGSASAPRSKHRFVDEPVYVAAHELAQRWLHEGSTTSLASVAAHSAEVSAVRQLVRPGVSAGSLVLTEPLLVRLPPQRRRPWWRFW